MSENHENQTRAVDLDTAFLKSRRGILKLGTLLVAFVCFTAASIPKYTAATLLEFMITLLLLLLYLLKLNKRLTFFFWPLIDVFNSVFAAVYFIVLSLMALSTYSVAGKLAGAIVCLILGGLLCVDSFTLVRIITFNKPRTEIQTQAKG
uniref:CKLF-like MARVEL transmembrane domain-containing protein 5 n=1 Tax=Stegastes partitus TaxID=144197 RepID=A0A3B5BD37_9TELE